MSTNTMGSNLKRSAEKLSPKKLKPLIKEIPVRIVERADQVLLGLSHTKQSIPTLLKQTLHRIEGNPNDLVGRVGRNVLERAESVRKQLIEKAEDSEALLNKRWVPDWVKDVSFVAKANEASVETTTMASDEAATVSVAEVTTAAENAPTRKKTKSSTAAKSVTASTAAGTATKKARAKKSK